MTFDFSYLQNTSTFCIFKSPYLRHFRGFSMLISCYFGFLHFSDFAWRATVRLAFSGLAIRFKVMPILLNNSAFGVFFNFWKDLFLIDYWIIVWLPYFFDQNEFVILNFFELINAIDLMVEKVNERYQFFIWQKFTILWFYERYDHIITTQFALFV